MFARALPIADAVLFEGYLLYPYRTSSLKNAADCGMGALEPGATLRTELVALGGTAVRALVRFREGTSVREIAVPPKTFGDAIETTIEIRGERVRGNVSLSARERRVALELSNTGDVPFGSAHALLGIEGGAWVSMTDPGEHAELARSCTQRGVWPVLVGSDLVLASPIILPDHPAIARESAGAFFDGTEIDEILALRILTLTDEEKRDARRDPRAAAILERVEALSADELARLHGIWRNDLRIGDRVRLTPQGGADVMDIVLAGKSATIVSIDRDADDRVHFAVTIDDDPGADLGVEGRKPGHRFYFRAEEMERL